MNRVRHRSAVAAAVIATALLAGCAADAVPVVSPGPPPAGVAVAVTQQRSDVADRQAEVRIENHGDVAIEVGAVRLDDPRFAAPATRIVDRVSPLGPGSTVDVRVQLPGAVCDAPQDAASTVTFDYVIDGRAGRASAPAPELFPFLAALHRRDCVEQHVRQVAAVDLTAFAPSPPGAPATLSVSIVPRGGTADVELTGIRETNLLTFPAATGGLYALDIDLADGHPDPTIIALPLVPARCDPHAVQEDKRGTVFVVDVVVDGEPGQFALAAGPALKGELLAWVTAWCGEGEGDGAGH